ncbi:Iron hydrogenase 1 [Candidatus Izimaplasma bacterium HR1]|jgi:iron-only hydrogenase group A|uniref:[Fe-Fe] hydrogenase large subunit C-terminal domain-containing protein n=1 Tax=Candidatus Izimoplasma sp. HR1 TaxID=1541959 RepID=UPI0004F76493|nr:Iron hydrogenase 1 [Candidatus Izimaplasma bacterium HR1]
MEKVTIKINGQEVTVPKDFTVMEAADELGIHVPRLCFLKDINETSACRLCVVDVKNMRGLKNSCTLSLIDGMEVDTDTEEIHDSIVANLELLASNHIFECWACERESNCEFLDLMRKFNVENSYDGNRFFTKKDRQINDTSSSIVLDSGKCILCGRCVSACNHYTNLGVLDFNERGNETYVGPALFHSMEDSGCIYCGKCIQSCPTAAIKEKSHTNEVIDSLNDKSKIVVAAVDPSVRVTLGEDFGTEIGENVEGKLFASLQSLGFDEVIDTSLATELSIQEEAKDLIESIKSKKLPLYTSKAPGWINYIEQYESELLENISSKKSEQLITGVLVKHHYAEKLGYNKENVVVVSIMPTISSKDECSRPHNEFAGLKDVDYSLTTKEYARLLKRKNITLLKLEDAKPYGELANLTNNPIRVENSVLQDTLTAASNILGETPQELDFKNTKGVKEATYKLAGKSINVALVHGNINIKEFFTKMKKTKKSYHYVEYMGSLLDGGGSPIRSAYEQQTLPINEIREESLRKLQGEVNKEAVTSAYTELLKQVGEEKIDNMLHTSYHERSFYK